MTMRRRRNATPREQGMRSLPYALIVLFVLATALFVMSQSGNITGYFAAVPVDESLIVEPEIAPELSPTDAPIDVSPITSEISPVERPPEETTTPIVPVKSIAGESVTPAPTGAAGFGASAFSTAGIVSISSCGNLSGRETYQLSVDLTTTSASCFTIASNDLILDCLGHNITGNRSFDQHGINASSRINVTVRNCIVSNFSDGIFFTRGRNGTIFNNTFINNSDDGIDLSNNNFTTVSHNFAANNSDNNFEISGWYINITNNTLVNARGALTAHGIQIFRGAANIPGSGPASYRIINNTFINNQNDGFNSAWLNDSVISGNTIVGSGDDALVLWNATGITVTNNNVGIGGDDGILLDGTNYSNFAFNNVSETVGQNLDVVQSHNNNFTNNTIYYGALDLLRLRHGSANNTFWNTTLVSNNSWLAVNNSLFNNSFTNTTFVNSNGSILIGFFLANITQKVNTTNLNISNNRAFLNATNLSNMNSSAVIFLNHAGTTFSNPTPGVDYGDVLSYVACPADVCTETASTTSTLRFNVSHWTSYRAQETAIACGDTLTTSTTMAESITGTGTCLTLGASNITLDCAGYTISFDSSGSGAAYGVLASFKNNVTVKNCVIQDASTTGANSANINFTTVNNSLIMNNTLLVNGTATTYGIFIADFSANNTIKNNTITGKTGATPNGIRLTNAVTNTAINLTVIKLNNSGSVRGIWLDSYAENSTLLNNTIHVDGRPSNGIDLDSSSRNLIAFNDIRANVSQTGGIISDIWYPAIDISGDSSHNAILNNSLWASEISAYAYGVAISGPSTFNNVTTNVLNPVGTGTGVYLYQASNNTVRNNTINATYIGVDVFVYVALGGTNASGNVIDANIIRANSIGVNIAGAANNNVTNNQINSSSGVAIGTNSGFNVVRNNSIVNATTGITVGLLSSNNTLANNNITTTDLANYAISISQSNNTNFTNTHIKSSANWIIVGANSFANFTNTTFIANNGTVRFPDQIHLNVSTINQTSLNITLNRTLINSTNLTAFNRSAVIALNGIVLTNPLPVVDYSSLDSYVTCPADVCTEISYSGSVFTFNVSHWTSFAAQETPVIPETMSPSGTFVINATNITRYGFENGTFNATLFNFTSPIINLTTGNASGNFTSQIIDVGHAVTWRNISWKSSPIGELPNFRNNSEQDAQQYFLNMSDLLLLMHFNNDAAFGESTSWAYDFSGRGRNGDITSVSPGGLFTATKKLGNHSIFFTSSETDRVSINDTTSFGMIDHMTMSIWVRPTGFIDYERIWVKSFTSNDPPYSLWGLDFDNTVGSRKVDFSIASGGTGTTATSTTRVPLDTWTHIAGTYNGTTMVVYVNGVRDGNVSKTGTIDTNSQPVDFAYNRVYTPQHFQGFMDEAALWNRTLSDDEILSLYKRGIHSLNLTGARSCDDAACSGESMTDFNTTVSPQNLSVSDNRYFQYRMQMSTENTTYFPELYNVTIVEQETAPVPNVTNVTLTKTDLSDPVAAGGQLNYTVTINNSGTDTAYNITLTDTYDSNVTFSSAIPVPTGATNGTFLIGNLTAGQVYVVNITVSVNSTVFNATIVNNTANISWFNTTGIFNSKNATISTTITGIVQTDSCRTLSVAGNYLVNQNLSMFGNFSTCFNLTANDINLDCNGFTLRGNRSEGQHGINASALSNLTVRNCIITNFTDGIVFSRVKNSTIFNNTALNNSDDGFDIRTTNFSVISHNNASKNFDTNMLFAGAWLNNITNNSVSRSRGDIFSNGLVLTLNSNENRIINNTALDNQNTGILITQSDNNSIFNNTAFANLEDGLVINQSQGNVIRGNLVRNNSDDGIVVDTSNYSIVDMNNASRNGDNNILLFDSNFNNVTNNTASNAAGTSFNNGIALSNRSNNNRIINNTASDNQDDGIQLIRSNSSIVAFNIVRNNGDDGIDVSNDSGHNISFNFIQGNFLGIALTPGFSIWIENNTITNNTNDGIFVARHSENSTFIRNLITDHLAAGGAGINLYTNYSPNYNITISHNIINNTGNHAIVVLNLSSKIAIVNNTIRFAGMTSSSGSGIYARDVKDLNITGNNITNVSDTGIWANMIENLTIAFNNISGANSMFIRVNISNGTLIWANTLQNSNLMHLQLLNGSNTTVLDSLLKNYTMTSSGITIRDTGEGQIEFNNRSMTVTGTNFTNETRINPNNLTVKIPQFNSSANLTLFGLSFTNAVALVDGEDDGTYLNCSADVCTNSSYSGGIFKFNISHWTTYSSEEQTAAVLVFNFTNVTITKTDSLDPVNTSMNFNYTILVNFTNGTAYNVTVVDALPAEVRYVSSVPSPLAGTNTTFLLNNYTNGTLYSINITVLLLNISNATVINNTANVTFANETGSMFTWNATINTTAVNVTVGPTLTYNFTNLSITKTDAPDPLNTSDFLNYTILVNITNGTAYNVTVSDVYSSSVRFNSSFPIAVGPTNETFLLGNLTAPAIYRINITVQVGNVSNGTVISNTANVSFANETGIVFSRNSTASTTVQNLLIYNFTNLSITKTDSLDPVNTSTNFNYTILVNFTNGTAYNVTVVDALPAEVRYVTSVPSPVAGTNTTFLLSNYTASTLYSINITVLLLNISNATIINNTANVTFANETGSGFTWNVTINTTAVNVTVAPGALVFNYTNLSVTKTDAPDPLNTSDFLNYTILVNITNGTAYNVTVSDVYASSVRFNSSFPIAVGPTNETFLLGNLTAPAIYRINITVQVGNVSNGTVISNTANVSFANETGIVFSRNSTASTTVQNLLIYNFTNLSITKTDSWDPANASELLNYSILINFTNATGYNITVSDSYPANIRFNTSTPSPVAGTNDTWLLNNLTAPALYRINITVNVLDMPNSTVINNTANVSFVNETGSVFSRNSTVSTTVVNLLAYNTTNISVVKSDVSDPVNFSARLNYTITITSTGTGMAYNVTMNETYPNETIFVSSTPSPISGTNTSFLIGNISAGGVYVVNISVLTLNISNGTVINNTANVSFVNETGYRTNVSDTEQTTVQNITTEPAPDPAPASSSSSGGGGGSGCTDACVVGESICSSAGRAICAKTGVCTEYVSSPCASGESCAEGMCKACEESWECGDWSECDGTRTRECYEVSTCGTEKIKPATEESCEKAYPLLSLPEPILKVLGVFSSDSVWTKHVMSSVLIFAAITMFLALFVEHQLRKRYLKAHWVYLGETIVLFGLMLFVQLEPKYADVLIGTQIILVVFAVSFFALFLKSAFRQMRILAQARIAPVPARIVIPSKPSLLQNITNLLRGRRARNHAALASSRTRIEEINLSLKDIRNQLKPGMRKVKK